MSRDEALENMAAIAAEHYPHPVFICECAPPYPDDHPLGGDGRIQPLDISWEQHIAGLMLEAAKGF